jgi:hypothetical protein
MRMPIENGGCNEGGAIKISVCGVRLRTCLVGTTLTKGSHEGSRANHNRVVRRTTYAISIMHDHIFQGGTT